MNHRQTDPRGLRPPRVSSLSHRVFAMLWIAFSSAAGESARAEPSETAIVSYTMAPGEVGASVETVVVARRRTTRTLTLTQQRPEMKLKTETLPLSPEEFDKIWSIVIQDKLESFSPDEEPGDAFDYGEQVLRTETRPHPGDPPLVRESSWDSPLKNESRLSRLVVALAQLARKRGKDVKLELFVP